MKEFLISLGSVSDVKDFVNAANKCKGEVTVYGTKHIVDGKSIMGLFSLDLSQPIKVEISDTIPLDAAAVISKYVC